MAMDLTVIAAISLLLSLLWVMIAVFYRSLRSGSVSVNEALESAGNTQSSAVGWLSLLVMAVATASILADPTVAMLSTITLKQSVLLGSTGAILALLLIFDFTNFVGLAKTLGWFLLGMMSNAYATDIRQFFDTLLAPLGS